MAYASGSKAWGISDRSGRRYRLREMKKEWTGSLVGSDEYESKQPQLLPHKAYPDPQALRNPRPEQVETKSKVLLQFNPFLITSAGSGLLEVIEPGHGRTTGDLVRFSKSESFQGFLQTTLNRNQGFQITVINTDQYTITVSEVSSSSPNTRGGGGFVAVETLQNNAGNVRVSGAVGTTVVGSINVLVGATEVTVTSVTSTSAVGSVTVVTS
jgi:hypothetical protein|tara:strand:+ start:1351 stop:1986 length:636 start_codon:yes stop_codon:yes gene_type:complete